VKGSQLVQNRGGSPVDVEVRAQARTGGEGGSWRVADLALHDSTWRVSAVGTEPDEGAPVSAVLTGRSSRAVLDLAVTGSGDAVAVEVREADLVVFGPEVVDLWVNVLQDERVVRRRVSSAGLAAEALRDSEAEGVRWYVTKRGNLSAEVASPAASAFLGPTLVETSFEDGAWRVVVAGRGVHPESDLVARGRRTKISVRFPLEGGARRREATFRSDELRPIGGGVVDLFVVDREGTNAEVRVAAGPDLDGAGHPDALTPYTTRKGMASFRRKTSAEVIRDSGAFDEDFYRDQVPDLAPDESPYDHYVQVGAEQGLDPSSMFDTTYYRRANPEIRTLNPFAHYCEYGWKELRNPSPRFDTWWYWSKHLDLRDESIAPLAHYEAVGKRTDVSTRPDRLPSRRLGTGQQLPADREVNRVCLFAAYDAQGIVDDYVVDYVRELSRFADVYYLADSEMAESELAKLDGLTKGAWAQPHGEYDFGSYKRLAERVGWDTLEGYDELLLVNDSCYLLRPLDDVFARMDARACDWWGLQASTRKHASWDPHRAPIPHAALDVLVDRV
jgi:hypothetical protein